LPGAGGESLIKNDIIPYANGPAVSPFYKNIEIAMT
jgi:hypothetical protein